ncbi:unnamed protein product [Diplocarpon coronariae]
MPLNTHKRAHESIGNAGPERKKFCNPKPTPNLIEPHPIVTVVTYDSSSSPKSFHIHKNYICHYSPFFRAAFKSGCQLVHLNGPSPDVFGMFVSWLYTQAIECGKSSLTHSCVMLWMLGEQILAPKLQNDALLAIEQRRGAHRGMFPPHIFKVLYDLTEEGSLLRMFFATACAARNVPLASPEAYPHAMLYDMMRHVKERPEEHPAPGSKIRKASAPALEEFFVDENAEPEEEWLAAVARNALAGRDLNADISETELGGDLEVGIEAELAKNEDESCGLKVEKGEDAA